MGDFGKGVKNLRKSLKEDEQKPIDEIDKDDSKSNKDL